MTRQAVHDFDEVFKQYPKHYRAYTYRGLAYHRLQKSHQAIQDFDKAIQLDRTHWYDEPVDLLYYYRGNVYRTLGKYRRAIQDYDRAIQDFDKAILNKRQRRVYIPRAYSDRAIAYRNLGEYTQADADEAKACSLDSKYC